MNKMVVIMGSPHTNGNVAHCVDAVMEGARQAGTECKKYVLKNCDIKECIGCRNCVANGGICVLQDDMQDILQEIKIAQIVLIASPIYICQVNGYTKTFLDRLLPLTDEHHHPRYGDRKLFMLYTYGAPIPFLFGSYIRYTGKSLKAMGLKIKKNIVISGCTTISTMEKNHKKTAYLQKIGRILCK